MYRLQKGELGGYFGKHTMMGEVENGLRGLKEILYGVSVVSNNTYSTYTKLGGRTHSAVALRLRVQLYVI